MPLPLDPLSLALGAAFGVVLTWLALRSGRDKTAALVHQQLEQERALVAERLKAEFRALSTEALNANAHNFLDLARTQFEGFSQAAKSDIGQLIQPVAQSLEKVGEQIREIEGQRHLAFGRLSQQLETLGQDQLRLRTETGNLVRALRSPHVRGRWGEVQLQRVVEMAGMLEYVDFHQQRSADSDEGRQRPDMLVRLPGGGTIIVDSKVPLEAYLDLHREDLEEAERELLLQRHVQHVRAHMSTLGSKTYWRQFQPTPDFVVMFLPDEGFFSTALRGDPGLIEAGMGNHVVPATPTTLIALLRAVQFGWRQEQLAENARAISTLGGELYERLSVFVSHLSTLGGKLNQAVDSYNKAAASLESRVLVSGRKLRDMGVSGGTREIGELPQIEVATRAIAASSEEK